MRSMPTNEPKREAAPTLQGRYRLVRTLEQNERGATFLGYDLRLHRWRAITVPGDSRSSRRLFEEAEILARLEHPSVERVIDLGEDGPIGFVVRDRLHGSATEHLPMKPSLAAFVTLRLAEGLAHAHARGIQHGHLRPAVVRFSEDGAPVLTGFGDPPKVDVSMSGRATEGWAHLAPEVRERGAADARSEVYSIGSLLYTLITGREQADLSYAEAYEGILAPIPGPLRPLLVRACAYDPHERPPDMDTFRALLGARMESLGSLGDLPWRPAPEPASPPQLIVPDATLAALASVLGRRPESAEARPVEGQESSSTMDSEGRRRSATPTYRMPRLHRKDPGFRDPFEPVDLADLPAYVDPSDTAGLALRRPVPLLVDAAGSRVGETPRPAPRAVAPNGGAWTVWIGLAGAVLVAVMLAGALTLGGMLWMATLETRRDVAFVRAVMAEQTSAEALATVSGDRQAFEEAWFRFSEDPTPENAARYVELVQQISAPLDPRDEARASAMRLERALEAWQN